VCLYMMQSLDEDKKKEELFINELKSNPNCFKQWIECLIASRKANLVIANLFQLNRKHKKIVGFIFIDWWHKRTRTRTHKRKKSDRKKKRRISFLYYQLICFFFIRFTFFFVILKIIFAYFDVVFWCIIILLYILCIQIINDHRYNFYFILLSTSQKKNW